MSPKSILSFLCVISTCFLWHLTFELWGEQRFLLQHEKLRKWLARNRQVTLHFFPTSSSWLDLVERFFELLTKKQLKHGALCSVKELKIALREFISQHNQPPTSFVWTKSR